MVTGKGQENLSLAHTAVQLEQAMVQCTNFHIYDLASFTYGKNETFFSLALPYRHNVKFRVLLKIKNIIFIEFVTKKFRRNFI
jgi:hypothetical protein